MTRLRDAALADATAGWWRVADKPSSLTPGGRAARGVEVVWSNRPLAVQLDLLDHHPTVPSALPQEATS